MIRRSQISKDNTTWQQNSGYDHLERRSTGLLEERLTEFETLLDWSISSQRAFNEALLDLLSAPVSSGRSVDELCGAVDELNSIHSKER